MTLLCQKTNILCEMKLLSNTDDSLNPPAINEVTHDINSEHIDAQWMHPDSHSSNFV